MTINYRYDGDNSGYVSAAACLATRHAHEFGRLGKSGL